MANSKDDDVPSNAKVSFQRGLRFLRLMFVVSFRFLSGSSMTLTYGSDVPDMSLAASSDALMMRKLSVSVCNHSNSQHVTRVRHHHHHHHARTRDMLYTEPEKLNPARYLIKLLSNLRSHNELSTHTDFTSINSFQRALAGFNLTAYAKIPLHLSCSKPA